MVTFRSLDLLSSVLVALAMVAVPVAGQESDADAKDIAFLCDRAALTEDSAIQKKEPLLSDREVSDLTIFAHFMIRLYQTFVSSQQHDVCVFTPSCSHFGQESVQRYGFIKGVFLTADRLTRCNGLVSRGGYSFDPVTGKFIDDVATYCWDSTGTVSCRPSCGGPPH